MGLEVDDDDVEELVEEHSKELSTEELLELHKEQNETLKQSLTSEESGEEEDKEESCIIPAKDLKDAFLCWSTLSKLAEDYHPDVGSVQKAIMESADVEELLESHCEDLSTADLQQLVAAGEIEDEEDDEVQDAKPRKLPTSVLSSILREVDKQLQLLEDNDYNAERSRIAVRGVKSFLAPYEQLLCERRKTAKQQTLDVFFKSTPKKQTEDTEPQPSTSGIRPSRPVAI
ncbi:hypothetical protein Hamer_G011804 [Homarus americanus]|uniref:Uncharacterized protein n=1 Tax=Homarus americanus TaxID=6706 RepID=A0A8J5K1N1_HOMAM|nr:hypothetical protein Hamer_G011804 [Homarus americanus]